MTYQHGSKISMRYEIDILGLTFDAFGTVEGQSEVQIANDYGFRRIPTVDTDGVNAVVMWINGGKAGNQIIVDNIVVAGPAQVDEWTLY